MLAGFRASNHPQQTTLRGARDDVDDRETAAENFAPLMDRFNFTLDVAAAKHNAKTKRFFTREDDGLRQSWSGERVWCNPPYSDCGAWVRKAWMEWIYSNAELIVMLLPANRTEQKWWQDHVEPFRDQGADRTFHVEFLRGRMRFIRPTATIGPKGDRPPFGCCLLIWQRNYRKADHAADHR